MKTKLFTLFLALVASVGTMFASVKIGDLYYDLDFTNKTAKVTYESISIVPGENYPDLTEVTIPVSVKYNSANYSVTDIGYRAFDGCESLTSITIPNSVRHIGEGAFKLCPRLISINVAADNPYLCSINGVLFNGNKEALIKYPEGKQGAYSIPNSVRYIIAYAFYHCTSLTSIEIPNSVIEIGSEAFYYYTGLTSLTIPNSVDFIGAMAFYGCTDLTSVSVPNSVIVIGDSAFGYVLNIVYNGTASGSPWGAKSVNGYVEGWFAYSDDTKNTLLGCCSSAIGEITIPNSVTSIGDAAFYGCTDLSSPVYNAHLFAFMPTSYSGAYTIPNGIESIAASAFSNCTGLTSVAIPNSLTTIGYKAFENCTGLTSVTIPNSVTTIGYMAFENCTGLTSVTIPNSVTSIGRGAFSGCTRLTSITCEAVDPPILEEGYPGVFGFVDKSIPLYVLAGSVDAYKTADQWKYFEKILPISAKETEVVTPTVEPEVTSAEIAWPAVIGAASYELVIKDANGNVICTLTFNEKGQLTSIAFNAPGRNAAQQTQSAGFAFTVTGLEPGTQYSYSITAKNESGTTLSTETGTFTTKVLEALDQINQEPSAKSQKLIKDGQILIQKADRTYTLTGQEVK